ncbi:putative aminotransferase, classes I and II [Tricharina praecox]|uniref:putative aminotransferase, classes I and II n=1 Tax=Tricharina praecox TaxID=43433 RepID=UPI00221F5243|nr:putative aminotransferase, classes I and II [Tricharina praecox]KAI5859202.1 putative aminotransferase, classes I and II [Tricharina praecox]
MNNLHLPGARSGVSTPGTPQLLVENETYKEEDQPLYNALLRSLQSAMTAATAIDTERRSTPHIRFREAQNPAPQHRHPGLDPSKASTGVVWTTERAYEHGFLENPEDWGNLGQGAPEVEDTIPHAFHKPTTLDISVNSREYGPVAGIMPLRKAVANLYNAHHRKGKASQYTWENVAIVPGGRAGLIRIAAVLNNAYLSFFIPDYTAYNEMLGLFKNFAAVPIPLDENDGYALRPEKIREEVKRGVQVILTSNPRNPTGHMVKGETLKEIMDICRGRCTLIMDEFYSAYNYTGACDGTRISCADFVEDVDIDDVLILDGMTKGFRLPGWRIAWVVGPKEFIKAIGSCGSYLDGGSNVPFQEASIPMLEPDFVVSEMAALQQHFRDKRDWVLKRLTEMGFKFPRIPDSTFYIWLDLSHLPQRIQNGLGFFEECLKEKVIVVPGIFFDLNPSSRRDLFDSPCHHFCRVSYGPKWETLEKGINGIERVLRKFNALPQTPPTEELQEVQAQVDEQEADI